MRGGAARQIGLLLFSLQGVRFAVPAEQVLATAPYDGEQGEELSWLHERIGFGAPPARCRASTVLTVGARQGVCRRVVVDAVEEIADFPVHELRPFPELMEPFCLRRGMWGVMPRHRGVVLLLDFPILFGRGAELENMG